MSLADLWNRFLGAPPEPPSPEPPSEGGAGGVYGGFIAETLTIERARKQSLEQRGIAVITTSGTLLTLLVAIATFARGDALKAGGLQAGAVAAVGVTLVLFASAAVCGLGANRPREYQEATPDSLRPLLADAVWKGSESTASMRVAQHHIAVLQAARRENAAKARALQWGLRFQTVAVVSLAFAVLAAILGV